MNVVIIWASFAGAWLLVAGPLYQGSIELRELDFDREGIQGIQATIVAMAKNDRPSAWWWLLPPVMYVLHRRWTRKFREVTVAQLTETQRRQFASYRNKATGWFTVATGATLLAAGETWQLIRHYDWPVWLFWLLIVVMLVASLLNIAVQTGGDDRERRPARAEPAPAAE
jgi:hypothetical protein